MLENPVLLLRPAAAGQARIVANAENGAALGTARWQFDAERGWWGRWLGMMLAVHEQEEAPLLFTVRRCTFSWRRREVRDADGEAVGYLAGTSIRDRQNYFYAQAQPRGEEIVYRCLNGEMLALRKNTPRGVELSFLTAIEADPFAKMLLLAAALLGA